MTNDQEILYDIAISMTRGVTLDIVKRMTEVGLTPTEFFDIDTPGLTRRLSLSSRHIIKNDVREEALSRAREELAFVKKNHIRALFYGKEGYPRRLLECYDAPLMLYVLGKADLDAPRSISMVGTRRATPLGTSFAKKIVKDLGEYGLEFNVVSGLAYGIDSAAHAAALEFHQPTIAVVAHGLDSIYPSQNRDLARAIIASGGAIVTEYRKGTSPFRANFLSRNRIIAALSDVVMVIESDLKGGAMSTAAQAFAYDREVMAMPGRVTDATSSGCNLLIRKNKASLLSAAADVIELTGWAPEGVRIDTRQRNLFPDLTGEEAAIYNVLKSCQDAMSLDELHARLAIPIGPLLSTLGEMEFDGIVSKLPGNRFMVTLSV
jgi:DNA processing protein